MTQSEHHGRNICDIVREVARAFTQLLRFGARKLQRMSWPALLLSCVAIAFLLTILPLALTLFVFFLLVKLAIGAFVVGGRRRQRDQEHRP